MFLVAWEEIFMHALHRVLVWSCWCANSWSRSAFVGCLNWMLLMWTQLPAAVSQLHLVRPAAAAALITHWAVYSASLLSDNWFIPGLSPLLI